MNNYLPQYYSPRQWELVEEVLCKKFDSEESPFLVYRVKTGKMTNTVTGEVTDIINWMTEREFYASKNH